MIRLLTSSVWGGVAKGVYQEWGPTTVPGEPYSYRDKSLYHCGIDIGDLGIGTPLYAARGGTVVSVGYGQLGIDVAVASEPQVDWYIHVDRSAVSVGEVVKRNQLCCYSGGKVPSGGTIYGAHLHFETQAARPPIYNRPLTSLDPEPVLTGLFSGGSGGLDEVLAANDPIVQQLLANQSRLMSDLTSVKINVTDLYFALGLPQPNPVDPTTATSAVLEDIAASIKAIPTGPGGTVDLSVVLAAIGGVKIELDTVGGDVATIKRRVEKDLAP